MAAYALIAPAQQWVDANGNPRSGYRLFFYESGTSTKKTVYSDAAGTVPISNPSTLNSSGQLSTGAFGSTGAYTLLLAPPGSDDPPSSTTWSRDGVSGINDTASASIDQWIAFSGTPTYVNATSFTLAGDQTSTFQIGRRLKTSNSGGTIYSTITNSVFGAVTTVTVANDSGNLDSGLSSASYGLLTVTSPSIPTNAGLSTVTPDKAADYISFLDSSAGVNGRALVSSLIGRVTLNFAIPTTSGTTVNLVASGLASIPYTEITILLDGVSLSGTDDLLIQLANTSGFITTTYSASTSLQTAAIAVTLSTAGFIIAMGNAGRSVNGLVTLKRMQKAAIPGGDTWACSYNLTHTGSTSQTSGSGIVSLGSSTPVFTLDGVRLKTSGVNTFDAGEAAIYGRF